MILQDLAVKALLEGHPEAARQLLPQGGPPEHAGSLLRDLKAMALGRGEVSTWPAERALATEPGRGVDAPRGPPPGLRTLIPEGEAAGWRPPVREGSGLPPLEQAATLQKPLIERAEGGLKQQRSAVEGRATRTFHHVHTLREQVEQMQDRDRERIAGLQRLLQRELAPGERALAQHLHEQGRVEAEIAQALPPDGEDECRKVIEEVERRMGRKLTDAEKTRVCKLWRQGNTEAEIVAILRLAPEAEPVPRPAEMPPDGGNR
jgi:hypothetical protein